MCEGKPILVVDDDPVSCDLMREILAQHGYEVDSAHSTTAALARIAAGDYRLVVADVFMPGIGGTVLAWQLREVRPDVPILLVTAFPNPTTHADARALGVPLLAKPFLPEELVAQVARLLNHRSGRTSV